MDTEYTSKIGFLELLSIKMQFESYSKKKQKRCIKYLKSKGIDTTGLEWKMNDKYWITNLLYLWKKNKKR